MRRRPLPLQRIVCSAVLLAGIVISGLPHPSPAAAQGKYVVRPVAEMKIKQLPPGPLYWRIENFPTLEQAKSAALPFRWNPDTRSRMKDRRGLRPKWQARSGYSRSAPRAERQPGGALVAEIGPVATDHRA